MIAQGGSNGGGGGSIQFLNAAAGGPSRVEVFGNGNLDLGGLNAEGITIGSLEGNGAGALGSHRLTIGANDLSTTFSGVIEGRGGLVKKGAGTLNLKGTNSYSRGTTVTAGVLWVSNRKAPSRGQAR